MKYLVLLLLLVGCTSAPTVKDPEFVRIRTVCYITPDTTFVLTIADSIYYDVNPPSVMSSITPGTRPGVPIDTVYVGAE